MLRNTLTACLWMGSGFVAYYTIFGLFPTHLQKDLHFVRATVALPIPLSNLMLFVSNCMWGWVADQIGRRWAMIIPAAIGDLHYPVLSRFFTTSYAILDSPFAVQGFFAGAVYGQNPSYLNERFPTEVRATAAGFCYHQGAIWGGLVAPLLAAWAATLPDRVHDADADRHGRRRDRLHHRPAARPGDKGSAPCLGHHLGASNAAACPDRDRGLAGYNREPAVAPHNTGRVPSGPADHCGHAGQPPGSS